MGEKHQKGVAEEKNLQAELVKMQKADKRIEKKMTGAVRKNIEGKLQEKQKEEQHKKQQEETSERALKLEARYLHTQRVAKQKEQKQAFAKVRESWADTLHEQFGSRTKLNDVLVMIQCTSSFVTAL